MRRTLRLPLEQLQPYLLDFVPAGDAPPVPLDWRAVFGNSRPVEIEVGFGKGLFLVSAGLAHPEYNYLGIEIERKYQLFVANRLAKRSLHNVRVVCGDARAFLRERVPDASVRAIHVYFPDPWWKQRHRKRRLFNEDFADQCATVLLPGGTLFVVTDVEEYFGEIQAVLAKVPLLQPTTLPDLREPEHDLDYLTNFERKYRKEDRPIYRAAYGRRDA